MEMSDCALLPEHRSLPVDLSPRNSTLESESGPEDGDNEDEDGEGMIQLTML